MPNPLLPPDTKIRASMRGSNKLRSVGYGTPDRPIELEIFLPEHRMRFIAAYVNDQTTVVHLSVYLGTVEYLATLTYTIVNNRVHVSTMEALEGKEFKSGAPLKRFS